VPLLGDGEELLIGRHEACAIRLEERDVSRRHARLSRQGDEILLEDLESANGVRVNGERLRGRCALSPGDVVEIGGFDLELRLEPGDAPPRGAHFRPAEPYECDCEVPTLRTALVDDDAPETTGTELTPPLPMPAAALQRNGMDLPADEAPRLVILDGAPAGAFLCARTALRLGSSPDDDLVLQGEGVLPRHCRLVRSETLAWRLSARESSAVTVNGEPWTEGPLHSGDVLVLGGVRLRFVGTEAPPLGPQGAPAAGAGLALPIGVGALSAGLLAAALFLLLQRTC
jgi:pSer/pThr/pTyr-binding forkhead associated (FHA) protein